MTLDEAREALARYPDPGVLYVPHGQGAEAAEEGTITSVNDRFAFVRYGSSRTSAATDPADLTLLAPGVKPRDRRQEEYERYAYKPGPGVRL
jgi:hypothetical protein